MIVFPAVGDRNIAEIALNLSTSPDYLIKLFVNNKATIEKTDTLDSFVEMDGCGYEAKTLEHGNWTIFTDEENRTFSEYAEQSWIFTLPEQQIFIYGYFIVRSSDPTKLIYADKLPYLVPIQYANDKIVIKPLIEWD